ncbi:MAG: RNA-protein complex protein Nop10 [Methanosarcinaceae archaeon]
MLLKKRKVKVYSTGISNPLMRDDFLGLKIRRCIQCKRYTMVDICPMCSGMAISPEPARFSPLDPYGKYRRLAKRKGMEHAGK